MMVLKCKSSGRDCRWFGRRNSTLQTTGRAGAERGLALKGPPACDDLLGVSADLSPSFPLPPRNAHLQDTKMSDNGSETPIVADVEEVQAVEVEAPKGKMSVEDALQVRSSSLSYHTPYFLSARPPAPAELSLIPSPALAIRFHVNRRSSRRP